MRQGGQWRLSDGWFSAGHVHGRAIFVPLVPGPGPRTHSGGDLLQRAGWGLAAASIEYPRAAQIFGRMLVRGMFVWGLLAAQLEFINSNDITHGPRGALAVALHGNGDGGAAS